MTIGEGDRFRVWRFRVIEEERKRDGLRFSWASKKGFGPKDVGLRDWVLDCWA